MALTARQADKVNARHDGADLRLTTVERSDAIDAAAALALMARETRKRAGARHNGGPSNLHYRADLRRAAAVYDAAAQRMQSAADNSF